MPERTLDQAGALAACKSWQKDAARARILYAEVRHIRSMRGAGTGTVRMDKILYSREVPVDASLETRLLPESPAGRRTGRAGTELRRTAFCAPWACPLSFSADGPVRAAVVLLS